MKTQRIIIVVTWLSLLASCSKSPPTPHPVVLATPIPRRLAPEGVYYLTQKISVTNNDGVVGFPPGTEVRRVSQSSNGMIVRTRNGVQTVLQDYQITNDLDIATQVARGDAAAQQAAAQARSRDAAARAAQEAATAAKATPTTKIILVQPTRDERSEKDKGLHGGAYDQKRNVAQPPIIKYYYNN